MQLVTRSRYKLLKVATTSCHVKLIVCGAHKCSGFYLNYNNNASVSHDVI